MNTIFAMAMWGSLFGAAFGGYAVLFFDGQVRAKSIPVYAVVGAALFCVFEVVL